MYFKITGGNRATQSLLCNISFIFYLNRINHYNYYQSALTICRLLSKYLRFLISFVVTTGIYPDGDSFVKILLKLLFLRIKHLALMQIVKLLTNSRRDSEILSLNWKKSIFHLLWKALHHNHSKSHRCVSPYQHKQSYCALAYSATT